jgi:hypothetical protein
MARPNNKTALLQLSQSNFERLLNTIEALSDEEQQEEFPPGTLNRNIRDVLCHLHHWHRMFMEWYQVGMQGLVPDIPAKGYSWKTTPELNRVIREMYRDTPLKEAKEILTDSHQKVIDIIARHSNEELFQKKRYRWTGTTSLGAYLISATSSHYDWAFKLIKKVRKSMMSVA